MKEVSDFIAGKDHSLENLATLESGFLGRSLHPLPTAFRIPVASLKCVFVLFLFVVGWEPKLMKLWDAPFTTGSKSQTRALMPSSWPPPVSWLSRSRKRPSSLGSHSASALWLSLAASPEKTRASGCAWAVRFVHLVSSQPAVWALVLVSAIDDKSNEGKSWFL